MANPLKEEAKLYQQIKDENIKVPFEVWDLMYHRIGDALTAINLSCEYYLLINQDMPIDQAKRIENYTRLIKLVTDKITMKSSQNDPNFPEFKINPDLHPAILEMFMHYIPNDMNCINLIIVIDPIDPHPVSVEKIKRILNSARSSKAFMDRLREATSQTAKF